MPKVCVAFGTRPEAIKMAPIVRELKRHSAILETYILVTAQHRDLLDQVLRVFDLKADRDLNLMIPDQMLPDLTAKVIVTSAEALQSIHPDMVVLQGDTTTTFGVALAAFYLKIPVAHVEAGLRTYDRFNPYPEEMNRHLTSVIADLHFAPTETAKNNLLKEGIDPSRIRVTGNPVIDALLGTVRVDYDFSNTPIERVNPMKRWLLVTAHRRENFGEPLRNICRALACIARLEDVEIVFPVHPNPNVQKAARELLNGIHNIHLIPPIPYDLFVQVMNRSTLCLTDSGGIQEEAPSLGKPVLVLRETTERPEAVEAGTVAVIGVDTDVIIQETRRLLNDESAYLAMAKRVNPYGDGKAALRIASIVLRKLDLWDTEEPEFVSRSRTHVGSACETDR